jgi:hypothetical protein
MLPVYNSTQLAVAGWNAMKKPYRLIGLLLLMGWLAGCATTPPQPAMAPLGQNGPFGYSDRPIVADQTTITYTGAYIAVSSSDPRSDARLQGELDKTRDLALWRAAQLGQQQGYAGLRVDNEQRDSDVEVRETPVYTPSPFYGYGRCWRGCYGGPWWFNDGYYSTQRWAKARAVIRLTLTYSKQYDPSAKNTQSIAAILSQMQTKWSAATY